MSTGEYDYFPWLNIGMSTMYVGVNAAAMFVVIVVLTYVVGKLSDDGSGASSEEETSEASSEPKVAAPRPKVEARLSDKSNQLVKDRSGAIDKMIGQL